jgi:hypothetical protein
MAKNRDNQMALIAARRATLRSTARARYSWARFPAEIRLMILEHIIHLRLPGWSSLAAVCKEWQAVIEPINFQTLTFGADISAKEMRSMTKRCSRFVKTVTFKARLKELSCELCTEPHPVVWDFQQQRCTLEMVGLDHWIYKKNLKTIRVILRIVKSWDSEGRILLEIGLCPHRWALWVARQRGTVVRMHSIALKMLDILSRAEEFDHQMTNSPGAATVDEGSTDQNEADEE